MKAKSKVLLIVIFLFLSLANVAAASSDVDVCNIDDPACAELYKGAIKTSDFILNGILSLDSVIAEQELNQPYVVHFSQSAQVPSAVEFNLFDIGNTLAPYLLQLILSLLEQLFLMLAWFLMILYNFTSSTLLETVIRGVTDMINTTIFDWSNVDGFGIRLVVIIGIISLMLHMLKDYKRIKDSGMLMRSIFKVVLNCAMAVFIATSGRTIVLGIENYMIGGISEITQLRVEENSTVGVEIQTKKTIFDLMQLQPFMLRNFGVMDMNEIENGEERVQNLLISPAAAKIEVEIYQNAYVIQDNGTALQAFFISLLMIVHRSLLFVVIGCICLLYLLFKMLKELLLALAMFNVVKLLFEPNFAGLDWFCARLLWAALAVVVNVAFTIILYALFKSISFIGSINPLMIIVFDVILIFLFILAGKNMDKIFAYMKRKTQDVQTLYQSSESVMDALKGTVKVLSVDLDGNQLSGAAASSAMTDSYNSSQEHLTENDASIPDMTNETIDKEKAEFVHGEITPSNSLKENAPNKEKEVSKVQVKDASQKQQPEQRPAKWKPMIDNLSYDFMKPLAASNTHKPIATAEQSEPKEDSVDQTPEQRDSMKKIEAGTEQLQERNIREKVENDDAVYEQALAQLKQEKDGIQQQEQDLNDLNSDDTISEEPMDLMDIDMDLLEEENL